VPGRGLLTVACLVFVALACISVVRTLERERRLLKKLTALRAVDARSAVSLDDLTDDERDCALSLASAGVLTVDFDGCYLRSEGLPEFRDKRLRLALSGALGALLLAALIVAALLRR